MNSLTIEDHKKLVILDDWADTSVVGHGWEVVATHPFIKAYMIGFDHKVAVKRNLDIVTACTVVEVNGKPISFRSMKQFATLTQSIPFCLSTS